MLLFRKQEKPNHLPGLLPFVRNHIKTLCKSGKINHKIVSEILEYINKDRLLKQNNDDIVNGIINRTILRHEYVNNISWALISKEVIDTIPSFVMDNTILEVGSGYGLWAALLKLIGVKIIPTDLILEEDKVWCDIEKISAKKAVKKYDKCNCLMLCWPHFMNTVASDSIQGFKGNKIIYVGEGMGGCTADKKFFNIIEMDWFEVNRIKIPQWSYVHDELIFYCRKKNKKT